MKCSTHANISINKCNHKTTKQAKNEQTNPSFRLAASKFLKTIISYTICTEKHVSQEYKDIKAQWIKSMKWYGVMLTNKTFNSPLKWPIYRNTKLFEYSVQQMTPYAVTVVFYIRCALFYMICFFFICIFSTFTPEDNLVGIHVFYSFPFRFGPFKVQKKEEARIGKNNATTINVAVKSTHGHV